MGRSCCIFDSIYIGIFGFGLWNVISSWHKYNECYAPIQLFLVMAYGASISLYIIMRAILSHLFQSALQGVHFEGSTPNQERCFKCFLYLILNPYMIYLTVQGWIWQIENHSKTPSCLHEAYLIWICLIWISLLTILITLLTCCIFCKTSSMHSDNDQVIQRRSEIMPQMNRSRSSNAQFEYSEVLNQSLMNEARAQSGAGLAKSEIDKIPMQTYSQSFLGRFGLSHSSSCSICCENYNTGDQISVLPKCNHSFHPACVMNWLSKNSSCPVCRADVRRNIPQTLENTV